MLKYLRDDIVFQEIPSEVSLAVAISGCKIRCPECHSKYLWEDVGTPLTIQEVDRLLKENRGVTNFLIMGGEHDIDALIELFMYTHKRIKTAWYCGLDSIPKDKVGICQYLDYLKTGHYDSKYGGLDSPITNQMLHKINHLADGTIHLIDITKSMQRNHEV